MRGVAAELGVTPTALYYHLRDKDELVRLVAKEVQQGWAGLNAEAQDWEAELRRYLVAMWTEQRRHPGLSTYLIQQPRLGVTDETVIDGVRFFEAAGFPTREAHLAWSFAMTYIHGRLSVDSHNHLHALPGGGHEGQGEGPEVQIHAREYVEYGVESVIGGLRSMLAEADCGSVQ
jgi:AcrR family transcriptional regulator